MAADGLTVKQRLAMLQQGQGNRNDVLSGRCIASPPSNKENNTPPKPVTDPKPATPLKKPVSPTANSSAGGPKPSTALKPPATPPKPTGDSNTKEAGQQRSALLPKHWDAPKPLSSKSTSPSQDSSSEGGSHSGGGDGAGMKDKGDNDVSAKNKVTSIQERMEALKKRASVDNDQAVRPPGGPGGNKFGGAGSGKAINGESSAKLANGENEGVGAPTFTKPSDLIKSINQAAADKVRRDNNQASSESQNRRKSASEMFLRNSDRKKFRQVEVGSVTSSDPPPPKPRPLEGVELVSFLKAYAAAKEEKLNADASKNGGEVEGTEEDEDDLYVEAESSQVPIRTRAGSVKRATSVRISKIPEFTEEEEEMENMYTDGASQVMPPPPAEPEFYDDCMTEKPKPAAEPDEPDEIYEPLDDIIQEEPEPEPSTPLPPPSPPEKKKEKDKEKDKDKGKKKDKAKEEVNKKEEKERKKKEDELRKLRSKFGLTDDDQKVGDGVVKANAGGGGLLKAKDLPVTKGQIVSILRMDGNPSGKWLVENEDGKIGYVISNNIEIATPTIRNLMSAAKPEDDPADEEPDEIYEPVAEEEVEDIYEPV